ARHGIDFLRKHGFDDDGRMFYAVTRDGRPLRKRRYLFTETFAAIGLAEYAKAANDDQVEQGQNRNSRTEDSEQKSMQVRGQRTQVVKYIFMHDLALGQLPGKV
ncbi:MAG: AGE family epimerase/isomerase, partial [Nitrospinae bacterium]|nr:AGE family epimerase/isomerase [Nitrospinota bacterium]